MTIPGGSERRLRNSGGISVRTLSTGERRYHARLGGRHVGAYATRAEAVAALAAAFVREGRKLKQEGV